MPIASGFPEDQEALRSDRDIPLNDTVGDSWPMHHSNNRPQERAMNEPSGGLAFFDVSTRFQWEGRKSHRALTSLCFEKGVTKVKSE
jgi:hypothetical protein